MQRAPGQVEAVAHRLEQRLAESAWATSAQSELPTVEAAAEIATFALRLSGKQRTAKRLKQVLVRFALAACLALAACSKPDAGPEATAVAISQLPSANGTEVALGAQSPRGSPGKFTDLTLIDPGSDQQPWAIALPKGGNSPVLIDHVGSGLTTPATDYSLAAQPINVGTRDGPSQFLDPLTPADSSGTEPRVPSRDQVVGAWSEDERYVAVTRAIAGQPTVLDAAYNAAAAVAAGGTHTYLNGVVLRVEPDQPVIEVIDRVLLESGKPTRAEDMVYVAIRDNERALYDPGTVVNLRDVVMNSQSIDVNGQSQNVFVANAALQGARVEPTDHVDLQSLLQPRLQRVDGDLAAQAQEAGGTPAPTQPAAASGATTPQPTATPQPQVQQPVIVNQSRGPSFVDDFLIWMWLSNSGFYRGNTVIINNPPPSQYRTGTPGGYYYSAPPAPTSSAPSTVASAQAASRSTAIQASRSAVSGQAAGTGGGVAATNKSAADASARVSAATSKAASAAGSVSSSSAGKSVSSVSAPSSSSSSSTASRSSGSTSAGTRGSAPSTSSGSSSTGSKGIGGASSSSGGGFGGKSGGSSSGGSSSS